VTGVQTCSLPISRYLFFHEDARFGNIPLEPYFKPVYDYIYEHYRPATDAPYNERYQIWVRI